MSRSTGFRPRRRKASPRWPLYMLLDTLRRQGWGPLDGRPWKGLRAVLVGLAARLPYGSAQGAATIEQVAAAAGYGLRWTRQCLTDLEDLGLIEWVRGGVRYGRPVPSWFRISKTMLAELVEAAREKRTADMIAWAQATRRRLERIRTIRMIRAKRKPRTHSTPATPADGGIAKNRVAKSRGSVHAAVTASPSPRRGDQAGLRLPVDNTPPARTSAPPPSDRPSNNVPLPDGLAGPALARAVLASLGR
ncbi:hypothetical protein GZ998_05525 [Actinomyces sp. 594]|uniref:hypothetical protein n=1 Tax=Actinomyces sp. 594 TaxID=2057793 RepID=UPI001C595559|nr:hypothetical protein [Actinomyces sp. 594]MBW3068973.1 hypothetical protein [Actinomyces sp. 594]